jgi:hypothetical protein
LIENDPEIIEASISANATGVRPVTRDGQRVWLVEGIEDRGSLDWVTEAGAGGRVIPLLEAAYGTEEGIELALLEAMPNDEFVEYLQENRPDLLEEIRSGDGEEAGGEPLRESRDDPEGGESDMAEITPEALQEALSESPTLLIEALTQSTEGQLFIAGLVEAKLEEERELTEAQAEEKVKRILQLRDYEREAHKLIAESNLPEKWQDGLRTRFSLQEGVPSDGLNVTDEVDDDTGEVSKPALSILRETVEAEIQSEREKLAEANPTRIRNQGGAAPKEGEAASGFDPAKTGWGKFLRESAHVDPAKSYGIEGAGEAA